MRMEDKKSEKYEMRHKNEELNNKNKDRRIQNV